MGLKESRTCKKNAIYKLPEIEQSGKKKKRIIKLEISNWKQKLEIKNWTSRTGNQKLEIKI